MSAFRYTHLIWDWNGTLFDDAWLCVAVMNDMLAQRGRPPITRAHYEAIFDFPVRDYYRTLGFDFAQEPFERLSDEFIGGYRQHQKECGLRSSAREALHTARERGLTQSILSAMMQSNLEDLLAHFDLRAFFTDVVGLPDHHAAGKLEVARRWLAAQPLDPAEMLFIGDTTHDHEVAQALGVDCYLIHSGHHARARLAGMGVRVLDSLGELFVKG